MPVSSKTFRQIALVCVATFVAACDFTSPNTFDFEGKIVFTAKESGSTVNQVYLLDGPTGAVSQLTFTPGHKEEPEISPDGHYVAFSWDVPIRGKDLYFMSLNSLQPVRVTRGQTDSPPSEPSWSPDGTQLVFSEYAGGVDAIRTTGANLRRISIFGYAPDWSPDGTTIVYAVEGIGRQVAATGGLVRTLEFGNVAINSPRWSPDGTAIVFSGSGSPDDADLYVVNRDGSALRQITAFGPNSYALSPQWSEDGRRIAFAGPGGLWFVNADGTDLKRIYEHAELAGPSWHRR